MVQYKLLVIKTPVSTIKAIDNIIENSDSKFVNRTQFANRALIEKIKKERKERNG